MRHQDKLNRRQFIKKVGIAAAVGIGLPYIAPSASLGLGGTVAPSNKITLGFVGTGMQGRMLLSQFLQLPDCRVVALCDVDGQKLNRAVEIVQDNFGQPAGGAGCAVYHDFRELLARKDIDGVVIAVPEHWHCIIAVEACRAGKDVYCEKPLALTIAEGRKMVVEARRSGCVFQTGSHQRSDIRFRRACELVRNGYIGQIKTVRIGIAVSGFPMYPVACNLPAEATPPNLDWNMWLGPVVWRPYNSRIAPPIDTPGWPHWRDYEEFAGGLMTDWGAHHFDIAQWGLGMDESGPMEIYPEDGRETMMLTCRYAGGTNVVRDDKMPYRSIAFEGAEGEVEVSRDFLRVSPLSLNRKRLGPNDNRLYKSDNHYIDWLDCIRSRQRPVCDVGIGCRSLTVCHLGIIAHRLGRPLKWDPAGERFVGDTQADRMLARSMRSPWRM
jgi:predicted dehydrogenase